VDSDGRCRLAATGTARSTSIPVIRTEEERLRIVFHPGSLRLLGIHRGVVPLRDPLVARGHGARSGVFDLGRGNEQKTRASGCCAHRGHSGHVGVQFERTGSLGQRRARRTGWVSSGPASSNVAGPAVDCGRAEGLGKVTVLGCHRFVDVAPLWGLFEGASAIARVSISRGLIRGAV